MHYRPLGKTGLYVSELCLGTMTFGGRGAVWSQIGHLQQPEVDALVARALAAGVNFIDTADVYSEGLAEQLLGQALKNLGVRRDDVVIATKGFGDTGSGANARGLSRYHLRHALQHSLRRLQLDHVDLYQVHGFDPATPIEQTVRALDELVRDGLVRYVGVSNWAAWQIVRALGIAERLGLESFASLQAYYTLAGRDVEREIVPMLRSEGLGLLVWSPLAGGFLSGKYDGGGAHDGARRATFDFPPLQRERAQACVDALRPIAQARGVSPARIALAWLLHQPAVSSVIIGAKRIEQLDDNLAASGVRLDAAELEALDRVSALPSEYPGWMIERQGAVRRGQMAAAPELTRK
ncbi:L-glyceraldehyde 3-phosphate reductase [mine drainage metagenome]|uniref:L-glyceraldehyde 3-phosphate reductase n=1 Tax=mine drainage metagenome TaxID=410659 RepID=A0A1J5RCS3_9ZZZZ